VKKPNHFRTFFEFSPNELRGTLVLIMITTVIAMFRYLPFLAPPIPEQITLRKWVLEDSIGPVAFNSKKKSNRNSWNLKPFNPNKTKAIEFRRMGFSHDFIRLFFTYRSKHSFVQSKEEFFAIYPFTQTDKTLISPNLTFAWKTYDEVKSIEKNTEIYQPVTIDVNVADSTKWQSITGIGPVLSRRILKYRNLLGGFHSYPQLFEVYGLDSALIEKIKPQLVNFAVIQKLNVNRLGASELSLHPYIDYGKGRRLFEYRKQHGKYKKLEDLLNVYGIDREWLTRIEPYLVLE
jgi:competence protein ComEA